MTTKIVALRDLVDVSLARLPRHSVLFQRCCLKPCLPDAFKNLLLKTLSWQLKAVYCWLKVDPTISRGICSTKDRERKGSLESYAFFHIHLPPTSCSGVQDCSCSRFSFSHGNNEVATWRQKSKSYSPKSTPWSSSRRLRSQLRN